MGFTMEFDTSPSHKLGDTFKRIRTKKKTMDYTFVQKHQTTHSPKWIDLKRERKKQKDSAKTKRRYRNIISMRFVICITRVMLATKISWNRRLSHASRQEGCWDSKKTIVFVYRLLGFWSVWPTWPHPPRSIYVVV